MHGTRPVMTRKGVIPGRSVSGGEGNPWHYA
jgi:hypothetical protein